MRFFNIAASAAIALATMMTFNAQASWKSGVFNDQTSRSVTVKKRTEARQKRQARRKATATPRKPASARRSASRSGAKRPTKSSRSLRGLASYYWQPQRVASGGWFNPNALTAAHKTLPFGTRVRVTNLRNGRSVVVRINDRGPFIRGRIIDLSKRAATVVGMRNAGVVPVRVDVL